MKLLIEKVVNTTEYCGRADIITGFDDFENNVEYNAEWHTYRIDGKIVPSVTQLLADDSYNMVDPFILERARKKGQLVHDEIEKWLLTEKMGFTDELQEFIKLFNENKELFSQKAIWDIKTTSALNKKKTKQQLEMYNDGLEYLINDRAKKLYAIHLPSGKKGRIVEL